MNDLCSIELLRNAVARGLSADEETALHAHLEHCEACCAQMEQLAGGAAWQQEAAALLSADELDAAVPEPANWSEVDFSVEHLDPSDDPNVLGQLGGYDVLAIVGRGGMGVVLKAFDRELKRLVAIKALAPHLAHSSVARKRFAREAQAAAAVVNPHVIAIHHVQPTGRLPFLIMPLLTGESLAQRLKARGPLELTEVLRIGMQAAAGLAAAHDQGLVHRDVKPANIFLEKGVERVVITDFGLARAADDVSMTRQGVVAGTPEYMSPEQARGETLNGRSDLFSLGCVLYEMATGVSPFRTDSTMATLRRIVDEQPAAMALLVPELPPWFSHIVERLLSKDPAQRFASASEVSHLLEQCLSHLQQPTSVPLPASLVPHAKGRRTMFNSFRKGVMAMLGTIGLTLLGMVLWQATDAPDISGQWTSEEWGTVVLEAKQPGRYQGTMTNSLLEVDQYPIQTGKTGKLELEWSRMERRFNGTFHQTWNQPLNLSGKLSIRLVGNEIRGAWTAGKDYPKQSGTPRLADLLWTRRQETPPIEKSRDRKSPSAAELEKQIQLKGRELFYGRMELTQEFKTLWTTKDQKREIVTSNGTARWLKKGGMTRIESDRMVPGTGTIELQPEQWTTGQDGGLAYSWNRVTKSISYGALRPGAVAYAPNLFFWGRSAIAFPQPMFGLNPKITPVTRDGRDEIDVAVDDPQTKASVRYLGIVPDRGYLPTRVETRINDRLESQVEFQDFFQPRPDVWAAKTILWTAWSADDDVDGQPIVASRTKFKVTKLDLGDDAKLQVEDFKLKLPDDVKVVDAATSNAAVAAADETAALHPPFEFRIAASKADREADGVAWFPIVEPRIPAPVGKSGANLPIEERPAYTWRGLLWNKLEHTLLSDGTWRVVKCDVVRSAQSTDLVPSFDIQITLDAVGGALLRRLTSTHLNQPLAIVVDGTIVAAPVLRTEFGADFVITSTFSKATAEKLAAAIWKPDLRKRATFGFRFADAKSALADLKDEATSRKIRGFEATIDARLNTVTITADAETLKALQEILGRLDSP